MEFGAMVRLVSPDIGKEMDALLPDGRVSVICGNYESDYMDGVILAVAATNDREVNRRVGLDAREAGVLASVADCSEECGFYFPAIGRTGKFTAGMVSNDGDHAGLAKAVGKLRKEMRSW